MSEPNWTDSKTLQSELWKNPLLDKNERLEIADGAVSFRDGVIVNLRNQITELTKQRDELLEINEKMREALNRSHLKLSAYVGVCKGDKELTNTVLPMVKEALELKPSWSE